MKIRVRYADTDQMRSVYYAKYFEYFEQARSDLLREIGLPYPEIERMGFFLPVIEAYAHYRKAAHYDELIEVITFLHEMPTAKIKLDYEIYKDGEREMLADGYTVHSFVNSSNGKPTRAPEQFLKVVGKAFQK